MNLVKLSHYVLGGGAITLASLGIVNASEAATLGTLGGRLFATGGNIQVEVLPSEFTTPSILFLLDPNKGGMRRDLVTNEDSVGTVVNVGSFASGVELIFGVYVPETGHSFLIGPNWRNPDQVAHAKVKTLGVGVLNVGMEAEYIADIGFEDRPEGGDLDYDDHMFQFRGQIAQAPPTSVPEPGMLGSITAFGLGAFFSRKLSQKMK